MHAPDGLKKELKVNTHKEKKRKICISGINLKMLSSVVILAPFKVDEFILATPAISAIKEALPPEGKITIITSSAVEKFCRNFKLADSILAVKSLNPAQAAHGLFKISSRKYDLFLNLNLNENITAALLFGAILKAPVKISYENKKNARAFESIYNITLKMVEQPQHKLIRYLNLVRFIGANTMDFSPIVDIGEKEKVFAREFFKKHGIDACDIIIGMHPAPKDEKNSWSLGKYQMLLAKLMEKFNAKILLFYHKSEKLRFNEFMHITKNKGIPVDISDPLKMAALSRYFSCFVCNENDFMHFFAPFTHIIAIWGETNPDINRPSGGNHEVLTTGDKKADSVPISMVLEHVERTIKK